MNASEQNDLERELELFRDEARASGRDPDRELANLETADEFISRMRSEDAHADQTGEAAVTEDNTLTRRRLRRWVLVGVGVAAASAAIVAGVTATPAPRAVADTPPILDYEFASAVRIAYAGGEDGQPALQALARSAAKTPEDKRAGRVQFKIKDSWFAQEDGSQSKIVPKIRKSWLLPDGGLVSETTRGLALQSDGRGLVDDAPSETETVRESEPAGTYDANLASSLPTRPEPLRAALLKSSGCDATEPGPRRSACLYREVLFLFQNYVVSQKTTAAIWTMLSTEEGFVSLGTVEDRAGRDGVGLSIIDPDRPEYRDILIASDETGRPLGSEQILIKTVPDLDVPAPSVVAFSAFMDNRWVAAAPSE